MNNKYNYFIGNSFTCRHGNNNSDSSVFNKKSEICSFSVLFESVDWVFNLFITTKQQKTNNSDGKVESIKPTLNLLGEARRRIFSEIIWGETNGVDEMEVFVSEWS